MSEITLKEQAQKSEPERQLAEKDFIYQDEMNIVSTVKNGNRSNVYPYRMEAVPMFVYEFIKTYLYGVNSGSIKNDRIIINSFIGLASPMNPVAAAPQIGGFTNEGLAIVENKYVITDLNFDGGRYQVTVFSIATDCGGPFITVKYYIAALGIDSKATGTQVLLDFINEESVKNSIYRNKIINLFFDDQNRLDVKMVERDNFVNEKIEEIFIPKIMKSELLKFGKCVDNYENFPKGLRYMFCGEPGTGKTKSIRTIMNMCYGKATIIMAEGEIDFRMVFEFAKLLSPAVVCFDDLDLLIGTRDKYFDRKSLGQFLQQLDGFEKNNVFLLCTTNDKELIDNAASRPGRFDLVLDFGKINKANYVDIIRTHCNEAVIIKLFDDDMLNDLKKKKVTGAFIVNLIKQLEIKFKFEPDADLRKYFNDLMEISYRGFYEKYKEDDLQFEFGFRNNGGD